MQQTYPENQVHGNQCMGLYRELYETMLCLQLAPSVEHKTERSGLKR
jgi:hypothetical protein